VSETTKKHKAEAPKKLKFGIFICSTSRYRELQKGEHVEDVSGDLTESLLKNAGHTVLFREVIPDDKSTIEKSMQRALDSVGVDAVVFCGGTGITRSDITIETVSPFLEKVLLGFGEMSCLVPLLVWQKIKRFSVFQARLMLLGFALKSLYCPKLLTSLSMHGNNDGVERQLRTTAP